MTKQPHGIIDQSNLGRKNDYLYRVSMKAVIKNAKGEVLVVKETDRAWWDLPGGGMDHGETIKACLARELHEEVGLVGNFSYKILAVEDAGFLRHANLWQLRLIFAVMPDIMPFAQGRDADEISYIDSTKLINSDHATERNVHKYAELPNS